MSLASLVLFFAVLSLFSFFFFWFCVCYFAWCLVFVGVWVVRKCGKAKGFSGFVHFFFLGLLIFSGFLGLLIFFSLFAFLENK